VSRAPRSKLRGNDIERRLRLWNGRAWPQSPDNLEKIISEAIDLRGHHRFRLNRHGHRQPDLRLTLKILQARGSHSDHGEAQPVDSNDGPDRVRPPVELLLPKALAKHRHGIRPSRAVIRGREKPAIARADLKHIEEAAADNRAPNALCDFALLRDFEWNSTIRGDSRKRSQVVAIFFEQWIRDGSRFRAAFLFR